MKHKPILCEYGILLYNGIDVYLKCALDNKECCFKRWCITDNCLKMTDSYRACKNLNK